MMKKYLAMVLAVLVAACSAEDGSHEATAEVQEATYTTVSCGQAVAWSQFNYPVSGGAGSITCARQNGSVFYKSTPATKPVCVQRWTVPPAFNSCPYGHGQMFALGTAYDCYPQSACP